MHDGKLAVQRLHLGAMRPRIVALLAIARLLVFALLHDARRGRAHDDQVRQPGHAHGCDERCRCGAADGGRGEGGGGGCGEVERNGQDRLQTEVDGEDFRLQGGELRPGEDAEGHDAADEALEDCAAQEGAVAVVWVSVARGDGEVW